MNVEIRPIKQIKTAKYNPRRISDQQLASLKASIERFGFVDPVIVNDRTGTLVGGHQRIKAAKDLGLKDVPVVSVNLDEAEEKALNVALNKISGEWDLDLLRGVLEDVQVGGLDLSLTGFSEEEWSAMSGAPAGTAGLTDPDEVPELPEQAETITQPGDLWLLGDHRLLCGDSTKAEDVMRIMGESKADLCFTSPPYNLGASVGLRNGARKGSKSAYNAFSDCGDDWPSLMRSFIDLAISVCGLCAINVQMLSGNKMPLMQIFGDYAKKTIDMAIWVKSNPQPAIGDGVMTSAFEFVWLLSSIDNPTRKIPNASFTRGTFSNVFEHATASGHDASIHGAVFPVNMAKHFIEGWSKVDCVVYEPFCGSGTTLIAAEQLGRKCYGLEISPQYCDVIVRRWEQFTGRKASRAG